MREKVLAFLAVVGLSHAALAQFHFSAAVQLYITTINATPTGGTWQVYAQVSDNNDGLANYDIDVLGSGGAVVNTAPQLKAPHPTDISNQYADGGGGPLGFNHNNIRGANSGAGRFGIIGNQTTVYGPGDDPTDDMGILVGVGQELSFLSPQNGTQGPTDGSGAPTGIATPVWNYTSLTTVSGGAGAPSYQIAGTLIEQGTYTTSHSAGFLTVQPDDYLVDIISSIEVLGTGDLGMNEPWTYLDQVGNTPMATVVSDTIPLSVPEPASLGLLGISVGFLNLFARRTGRQQKLTSNSKY